MYLLQVLYVFAKYGVTICVIHPSIAITLGANCRRFGYSNDIGIGAAVNSGIAATNRPESINRCVPCRGT